MSDEIKKEEPTQTDPKQPDNKVEDMIEVDVFSETIKLPLSQARKIIEKRDSRHAVFRDLDAKVKDYEQKLADTTRQAEAQKKALEGKLSEAEALFSKKSDDKLANIQNRIIHKELESALLSDDTFIKESKEDALKLLKADMKFKLSEEGDKVLTEDGKDATEQVKEWLKNKAIFRKATGIPPTGGKVGPKNVQTRKAEPVSMATALAKHLNNKDK